MELHQLRVLREVAAHGSIGGAARALAVTPSAVSQVLSALQREFPVALTERRGRSVALTEVGHALSNAAVRVDYAMEEAATVVDRFLDSTATPVRVSAFPSAAAVFFPELTGGDQDPGMPPVTCSDDDVDQESFPALTSTYDIVIGHRMSHSAPWPEERLTVFPLIREPFDVALRADHRLAAQSVLSPVDLISEEWVSAHENFPPADMLQAVAATAGRAARVTHRINDFAAAVAIVAQSELLALVPRFSFIRPFDSGVVLRPLRDVRSVRHIDALLRPEKTVRTGVKRVLGALRAAAEALQHRHREQQERNPDAAS